MTESNDCFILQSLSLFFNKINNIFGKRLARAAFQEYNDRDHINDVVSFTHEQNYSICCQKQFNDIAHEHTIICRSCGGLSANEKEETFASNDNVNYLLDLISYRHYHLVFLF